MHETATVVYSRICNWLVYILVMLIIVLIVWLAGDLYLYETKKAAVNTEIAVLAVIIVIFFMRTGRRCVYRLDDTSLSLTQKWWWRTRRKLKVDLVDIVGLYPGRPRKFGPLRCKDTDLVHAVLDRSEIWAVVYYLPEDCGDSSYRRIFFKPGQLLLEKIQQCLPGKTYACEEELYFDLDMN